MSKDIQRRVFSDWLTIAVLLLVCMAAPAYAHHGIQHAHTGMDMPMSMQSTGHGRNEVGTVHCDTPAVRCAVTVTPAVDPQGNIWIAYANGKRLYVQKHVQGGGFAPVIKVNAKPEVIINDGENRPQLVFGPNGTIFVAWSTPMAKHWTCKTQFARSLDGQQFSAPITVNHNHQPMTHCYPAMQVNAGGDVFIAWLDWRDHAAADKAGKQYNGMAVYYNWSTDKGKSFHSKDLLLAPHSCECCRIAMAIDGRGLPLVFFRKVYPGLIRDHALVTFSGPGNPNPPQRISFDHWKLDGCPEQGPAIAHVGGRTHLIWYDKGRLHYRQRSNGELTKPAVFGKKGAMHPSIAAANGTVYRVWQRYADGAMHIWMQTSTDNGLHWSKPQSVAQTAGASDYPELVSTGQQVWLSWKTSQQGYQLLALPAVGAAQ